VSIIKAIEKAEQRAIERGWDKVFYFFDIHETILYPDYSNKEKPKFYPFAKEVLQYLSKREDISISLYTCSYPEEIVNYIRFFESNSINFEMVNKNSEVKDNAYGYYRDKPYFNVLFEDKSGFDAEKDWLDLIIYYGLADDIYISE
jgi:hypothetical protein